ncbi:MAG TPA: hypothetical protein VHP99_12105 [Pyrinomonadaceae bacterium]|nr:hypothetical protein [Pyrinomonadaceae bacterium]
MQDHAVSYITKVLTALASIRRRWRSKSFAFRAISFAVLIASAAATALGQTTTPNGDGWVVLPVSEYAALRHAAFPAEAESPPLAVEATLSRLDYDLKVDGDLASGEARLTIDVIRDGWVRVPLPDGLMVREAKLDGREVSLVTHATEKGPGSAELLLSKTGRSVLTLKIVAQVSTVAGTDILQLPVSNSAVSRAVVELNRQGVDVHISGGLLLEHSESAQASRWVANGRGNEPLTFAWRRKVDDQRASQPLRLRGTLTQLVGIGEDSTQINAEVRVDILQGVASEVRVQLPDQFTVNQVSGATVADWDAKAYELTVSFIEPVQDTTRFTISGELRLPRAGKVDVPLMRLPAAERETGGVAVEVLGAGEIKDRQASGLEEAEAAELGQLISSRQSPSLIAYRLPPAEGKSARSLSLDVARYTPQAVLTANIEEADYSALVTNDGKLLVQTRFAVRNNQRNFLKLNLPATATLWSASVAGRPIRPGRAPDGSLLLPLEKNKSGDEAPAFVVEVSYLDHTAAWPDKGHFRLSLLAVDLPISKSHLLLHHPPLFRLAASPGISGNFRVTPFESPESTALTSTSLPGNQSEVKSAQADAKAEQAQQLVSQLHTIQAGKPIRNLPLRVAFPHFGPSIFLKSELTSENQTPVIELDFQRDRKRGER